MKVFVIMGNDYPAAVHKTEAGAEASIAERKARDNAEWQKMDGHGLRFLPPYSNAGRVYWRAYEFELQE